MTRILLGCIFAASGLQAQQPLRVCADPDDMPFSNRAGNGLENKLAALVAARMNAKLEMVWWAERKDFVRHTLDENRCDVVMGVPTDLDDALTTKPYYRSTYVFVSRADRRLEISSLADPQLASLRIGVHIVGDDYAPPAIALAQRGLAGNITGYGLFGKYGETDVPGRLVEAVAAGAVDVAIVWGPLAGYFAQRSKTPLTVTPIHPAMFQGISFVYSISAGVRKTDVVLKQELENVFESEAVAIQRLVATFGIPNELGRS